MSTAIYKAAEAAATALLKEYPFPDAEMVRITMVRIIESEIRAKLEAAVPYATASTHGKVDVARGYNQCLRDLGLGGE